MCESTSKSLSLTSIQFVSKSLLTLIVYWAPIRKKKNFFPNIGVDTIRPRSFWWAGFRPRTHHFVWFVPLAPNSSTIWFSDSTISKKSKTPEIWGWRHVQGFELRVPRGQSEHRIGKVEVVSSQSTSLQVPIHVLIRLNRFFHFGKNRIESNWFKLIFCDSFRFSLGGRLGAQDSNRRNLVIIKLLTYVAERTLDLSRHWAARQGIAHGCQRHKWWVRSKRQRGPPT